MDLNELVKVAYEAGGHREIKLAPGEILFKEGEQGDQMFVISGGTLNLTINDEHLDTETVGGVVGEMALIEHMERSATATAVDDCTLIPLGIAQFTALVSRQPGFAIHIMKIQSQRLRKANEILNLF